MSSMNTGGVAQRRCRRLAAVLGVLVAAGCAGVPDFPEVDVESAQWQRWTGEAEWERPDGRDVSGRFVVAENDTGDRYITMVQSPLTLFTARTHGDAWRIESRFAENRGGRGAPPERMIWFAVPGVLAGEEPPEGWRLQRPDDEWLLAHAERDERLLLVVE